MKKLLQLKTMLLLCALIVGSGSVWAATYNKITSTDDLVVGKKYLIVYESGTTGYVMAGTSSSYMGSVSATISNGSLTLPDGANIVTLGGTSEGYTLALSLDDNYLYYSGSGTGLSTNATVNNNTKWTISFENGDAKIRNVGKNDRYARVYNSSGTYSFRGYTTSNGSWPSIYKEVEELAYSITAIANPDDGSMGSVSVSEDVITATPTTGYRVSKSNPYSVSPENSAEVLQNGNKFTVIPSANTTVTINFEEIPSRNVCWSVNGIVIETDVVLEGNPIEFVNPSRGIPEGYYFRGWSSEEILTPQDETPEYVSSAICESDITYYAVIAEKTIGNPEQTLTQTLTYDNTDSYPWVIGGDYTDRGSYTLFHNGGYVKSASFDLSKLAQVKVYGGTFGGSSDYKYFTIGDGTNVWIEGELTGTNNGKEHSFTGGTALTGTSELYITSTCGSAGKSPTGIRISKVEIFTLEPTISYVNFCTTVPPVTMTITSAKYATFSNASAVTIPDGVTAYYAQQKDENTILLKEIAGNYIPANTGVVVNGEADDYNATVIADVAALGEENLLQPWLTDGTPEETTYYTLAVEGGNPVFKQSLGGTLAAGKAYLVLPAGARELSVVFDNEFTGIEMIENATSNKENNTIFNIAGQRVAQPAKGLYIVNGKKYVVK